MRGALWFAGVPLAAFVGGMVGSMPVVALGLSVPIFLVGPLGLLTGALLATLFASWVANLSSGDASGRTRSRLGAILGVSLLGALAAILAGSVLAAAVFWLGLPLNLLSILVVCAVVLSGMTTAATWRLRSPAEGNLGPAGAAALALSAAWLAFLALVEGPGYLLGLVPAGFAAGLPVGVLLGVCLGLTAAGALLAAREGRRDLAGRGGYGLARDAGLTLVLAGLAPALVIGVVFLGCRALACGP